MAKYTHIRHDTTGSILAIAVSAALSSAAMAQEDSTGQGARDASLEEITVTGSRIRRTTDFDTANPTTVVDAAFLQNLGMVNVGDAIQQLPTNLSNNTPATPPATRTSFRRLDDRQSARPESVLRQPHAEPGEQPALRADEPGRRRRPELHPVDPHRARRRGDRRRVRGLRLRRHLGRQQHLPEPQARRRQARLRLRADGRERRRREAYRRRLRHRVRPRAVATSWSATSSRTRIRSAAIDVRDWCREGNGFFQNTGIGMHPGILLGTDIRANQMSTTGTFYLNTARIDALGNTATTFQADAAGTGVIPFDARCHSRTRGLSATAVVPGGDGRSIYQYTNLRAPVKRNIGTATFTYALTDSLNMNVDLSYGKVETVDINGALDAHQHDHHGGQCVSDAGTRRRAARGARHADRCRGAADERAAEQGLDEPGVRPLRVHHRR